MFNEKRFIVVHSEGSSFKNEGRRQILLDRETGVQYLTWSCGYGASITPLLDKDGKPVTSR